MERAQLTDAYLAASPLSAGSLTVIIDRSQVEARARDLQAKLVALGITDVSAEGRLILGGSVQIEPGLRRGVGNLPDLDTSAVLDLDTLPALFDYTRSVSAAPVGHVSGTRAVAAASGGTPTPSGTATPTPSGTATPTPSGTATPTPSGTAGPRRALVMSSSPPTLAVDEAIIALDELQLQDGLEMILTRGVKYLTIIAGRVVVGTDTKITWTPTRAPDRGTADDGRNGASYQRNITTPDSSFHSPSGGDGWGGDQGDRGYDGDDAPTLEIWALEISRLPAIELSGGTGGRGQRGGDGGNGGNGAKGAPSHANLVNCVYGPGFGGDGGDGGTGGNGGAGGVGGRGGYLNLYLTDDGHDAVLAAGLSDNRSGGQGGAPGGGGTKGRKGYGGEAGDPDGLWCLAAPERAGADGHDGTNGVKGKRGLTGPTGQLVAVVITRDDFHTKWTSPQVRTVTPTRAEVGDVITVEGANFTADAVVRVDGVAADTTFVADTILQAEVPRVGSGWVEVVVEVPGGKTSNPASLKVLPTLLTISSPAAVGSIITIQGSGFAPGCHVLFRGAELDPDTLDTDGTLLTVTLPAPPPPFEDPGGVEPVAVRNPDGVATAPFHLVLRPVLSTGFDVARNGYGFLNAASAITGVANLDTFAQTYGPADVAANFALEPVLTGAWYLWYRHYFNQIKAGYSSAFSITSADEYWSGNPDLFTDYTALSQVEPLLTVAQGHILSQELLVNLAGQAAAGASAAETALDAIEAAFRTMLTQSAEDRRRTAPILQLIPAGTILTSGFLDKLHDSHGLLPTRIEYPAGTETWEKRLVVYDNAGDLGLETRLVFTRNSNGLAYTIERLDEFGAINGGSAEDTAHGWTLSHLSLEECWLTDVTMPLDYVFILSPATLLIEDRQGRRFGVAGDQTWNDLPGVVPAAGTDNLFLLPLDQDDLRISVVGTGNGSYTLGVVAGSLGRSVTLTDVPVQPDTRDTIQIADALRQVTLGSTDADKTMSLHYGIGGVHQARALTLSDLRIGRRGGLALRAASDLTRFELSGASGQSVSVGLAAADKSDVRRQRFDQVSLGDRPLSTFNVADWTNLGPGSLHQG